MEQMRISNGNAVLLNKTQDLKKKFRNFSIVGYPNGSHTCGRFSLRMRIENWELNIGQILPSPHSAKSFLREP